MVGRSYPRNYIHLIEWNVIWINIVQINIFPLFGVDVPWSILYLSLDGISLPFLRLKSEELQLFHYRYCLLSILLQVFTVTSVACNTNINLLARSFISISLYIYLSIYLYIYLYLYLSIYFSLFFYLSISIFLSISQRLYIPHLN